MRRATLLNTAVLISVFDAYLQHEEVSGNAHSDGY